MQATFLLCHCPGYCHRCSQGCGSLAAIVFFTVSLRQPPNGLRRPYVLLAGYWRWAGVDNAWEQEKLEARKMLENTAESPASSAPKKIVRNHFIRENVTLFR